MADPRLAADLAHRRALIALLQENAFCASVNFDPFIVLRSSPSQEGLAENSSFNGSSSQGAGC